MVDIIQIVLGTAGTVVLVWTLLILRREIMLQQEDVQRQNETWQFEIYQRIDNRIADLVWFQSSDPRLNNIYSTLTDHDRSRLRQAQGSVEKWGAWETLGPDERVCYRFIRIFLENLEQMWEVRQRGWMTADMWKKWQGWIEVWCETRYFEFVFEDQRPRLLDGFAKLVEDTCDELGIDIPEYLYQDPGNSPSDSAAGVG